MHDWLFLILLIIGVGGYEKLTETLGPGYTTIIICVGFVCFAVVGTMKFMTQSKCCSKKCCDNKCGPQECKKDTETPE